MPHRPLACPLPKGPARSRGHRIFRPGSATRSRRRRADPRHPRHRPLAGRAGVRRPGRGADRVPRPLPGRMGRGWSVLASAIILRLPNDPEVAALEGDIAGPAGAGRVMDAALERFGRLDTLVNNAGMVISKPFTDYTAADYADVVGVGLTAGR